MLDTSGQDREIQPRFGRRPMTAMVAVVVAVVLILLSFTIPAVQRLASSDMSVARDTLRLSTVVRGDLERDIAVEGTIVASNSPGIYAPTTGIISLMIKPGDRVTKGQLLASIDSPQLDSQLAQEQTSLDQNTLELERLQIETKNTLLNLRQTRELAAVNVELARSDKNRAQQSIESDLISQEQYEQSVAELKKAELEFQHAVENIGLQQENLEFEIGAKRLQIDRQKFVVEDLERQVAELQLTSPIDGVVGNVNIRDRDNVGANTLLITLVDLTAFEIDLAIPETYADDLGIGMKSEITFNGESKAGELVSISPEVEDNFVVGRMRFTEDVDGLRQNQRVNVRIIIESRDSVLKVRNGAFVETGGGRLAYVLKDNIATRQDIRLGARSIAEVEIASGLSEGDQVIISSLDRFNSADTLLITD